MNIIDLRSDTVTLPTPAMREAIFAAQLGDDVFSDDPTVNRLEEIAAEKLGKEAALLVPSGTMANLVSSLTHCARGEEAILGDLSHMFLNEAGGMSALGGIHPHIIPNQPDGTLLLSDIEAAIRGPNVHFPRTRLICLENTHNRCSGAVLTAAYIGSISEIAKKHGLSLHLDGARIFNAAVACRIDVTKFTRHVDSVSFCMSKGLSAPVGSLVCGTAEFIKEARRARKVLGGGMRQAGIIAAAGIVALEQMIERLEEDHENAYRCAEGIANIPGLSIDVKSVQTNIIYFDRTTHRMTDEEIVSKCLERGVCFLRTSPGRFRIVTHYGITSSDIDTTIAVLDGVMKMKERLD